MYRNVAILLLACAAFPAQASVSATGSFSASQSCEAFASFAKRSNPGAAHIAPGNAYTVREVNKTDYDWLRVEVPGAQPSLRWVQRSCGTPALAQQEDLAPRSTPHQDGGSCSIANEQDSYLLAITWQPGFCEHVPYKGKKPECDAMNSGALPAKTLSLHGLWPNKQSCGTHYGSCEGAPFALTPATIAQVAPWMPNFFYERSFGAYEWNKHGKCQSLPPDQYFIKAASAVKIVNDSAVGDIVLGNVGKSFRVSEFFDRVKARHGEQVAGAITLVCAQKKYLQEIRVALPLDFRTDAQLTQLVGHRTPTAPRQIGCAEQIYVEAAGK